MFLKILIFIIIGIAGGVIGGMGMGGGTFLIPLLTIFAGLDQHVAQAINLLAFIPMSIVALIIHMKNKLVDFKYFWLLAIPAAAATVPASFLAAKIVGGNLSLYFGIFLIILGVYQLTCIIIKTIKDKKSANIEKP